MQTPPDPMTLTLLDAILPEVAFDGWSPAAFKAAIAKTDMTEAQARSLCPRGAIDLAILYHQQGDAKMAEALMHENLEGLRYRERVARAIRLRLDAISDREAVRRGSALFALPHMAPEGAKLMWGTADAIWAALGDDSDDVNWYTKRATLAGVYGSVVLYWLGDDSVGHQATDAFINRRIDNVMQIEKVKAAARNNPLLKPFNAMFGAVTSHIRRPQPAARSDLPGVWRDPS